MCQDGRTALIEAAKSGHTVTVQYLVQHKADVTVTDNVSVINNGSKNYRSLVLLFVLICCVVRTRMYIMVHKTD